MATGCVWWSLCVDGLLAVRAVDDSRSRLPRHVAYMGHHLCLPYSEKHPTACTTAPLCNTASIVACAGLLGKSKDDRGKGTVVTKRESPSTGLRTSLHKHALRLRNTHHHAFYRRANSNALQAIVSMRFKPPVHRSAASPLRRTHARLALAGFLSLSLSQTTGPSHACSRPASSRAQVCPLEMQQHIKSPCLAAPLLLFFAQGHAASLAAAAVATLTRCLAAAAT